MSQLSWLQVLKSKERPLVSSVFFMCLPDKVGVGDICLGGREPCLHTAQGAVEPTGLLCEGACKVYPPDARCGSPHPAAPDGTHSDSWPPCDYTKAWAVWAQDWMPTVSAPALP